MKRSWAVLLAAAALLGCRNSQPSTNPFLRTTVPPPGTGDGAVVVPAQPYYPGATPAPPPTTAAPVVVGPTPITQPPPPVVAPPRDLKASPPGGSYQYHQSSTGGRKNRDAEEGEQVAGATETGDDSDRLATEQAPEGALRLAGPSNAVHEAIELSKEPNQVAVANFEDFAGELPGEFAIDQEDADADVDQPVVRALAHPDTASKETPRAKTTVTESATDSEADARAILRLAVDAAEADEDAAVHEVHREVAGVETSEPLAVTRDQASMAGSSAAAAGPGGDFSFAADYSSLSGQLEYSRSSRQWKLRYIPIDGQTDDYGGSVLLGDSAELAQFKPGDRVSVRGSLAGGPSAGGTFSPRYRLDGVERLSR